MVPITKIQLPVNFLVEVLFYLGCVFIALFTYAAAANPQEFHQFDCLTNTTELSDTVKQMIPKDTTKFDCSNRPIKNLQANYFADFSFLTDIILTGTLISRIPSNAFSGLSNLKFLDLSNNPVRVIEIGSFDHLKQLKELRLGGIAMRSIRPALIKGLTNLEFLVRPDGVKERLNRGARNDVTAAADGGMFTKKDMSDSDSNVTKESEDNGSFARTDTKMGKESNGRHNLMQIVFLVACVIVPLGGIMTFLICRKKSTPPLVPSQLDGTLLDDCTEERMLDVETHEVLELNRINDSNEINGRPLRRSSSIHDHG